VRLADLGESDLPGELADSHLVFRVPVAVHAQHRHGAEPVRVGGGQFTRYRVLVEGYKDVAVGADPLSGLDHPLVQQFGQHDLPVEDARPILVGDPQRVTETRGDHQHASLARALQQGVRRDRGTQPDRADLVRRDWFRRADAGQLPDPGHGGVPVRARILRQQLVRGKRPVGPPRHDIGERAAPVNPELPPAAHPVRVSRGRPPGFSPRAPG